MISSVLIALFKILIGLGSLMGALFFVLSSDSSAILIESRESKTEQGKPIFNKISYQSEKNQDIWFMEQSHQGVNVPKKHWDKIAIVVDKQKEPYEAQFYQYQKGPDEISLSLKPTDFKVSCFMCHSNGPRAIRANLNSTMAALSLWDHGKLLAWNLRIKAYGKINGKGVSSRRPFRHSGRIANQVLQVKTCKKCHKSQGLFARGELTKQNFMAIGFMVENNEMPPPGYSLTESERREISEFLAL